MEKKYIYKNLYNVKNSIYANRYVLEKRSRNNNG